MDNTITKMEQNNVRHAWRNCIIEVFFVRFGDWTSKLLFLKGTKTTSDKLLVTIVPPGAAAT